MRHLIKHQYVVLLLRDEVNIESTRAEVETAIDDMIVCASCPDDHLNEK